MAEHIAHPLQPGLQTISAIVCLIALPGLAVIGSPILALFAGAAIGLGMDRAPFEKSAKLGKLALQAGIVLLAIKMDFGQVAATSASYLWWVAIFVPVVLLLGYWLARRFALASETGKLLSAGTAICGGTAIATLAPTLRARAEQLAVCLAIVFVLNAIAVVTFPMLGAAFGLSQEAFGVWAALAIHDTASVVAAAAQYGDRSLEVATTLKLARMLCLVPVVCLFAYWERSSSKASIPTFIVIFIAVALMSSFIDIPAAVVSLSGSLSYALIVVALFFVGTELRRNTLLNLRGNVLTFATILWVAVVVTTLTAVILFV